MKIFNYDITIKNTKANAIKELQNKNEEFLLKINSLQNSLQNMMLAKVDSNIQLSYGNGGILEKSTNNVYQTYYRNWSPEEFQNALMQASRTDKLIPIWYTLFNIFNNMMLDPHITACFKTLYTSISSQRYVVMNGDVVDDKATDFLKGSWFVDYCKYTTLSSFYGFNLVQVDKYDAEREKLDIELVNPFFVRPDLGGIVNNPYDVAVTSFNGYPAKWGEYPLKNFTNFIFFNRIGQLSNIFKSYICKQHALSAWNAYMERYGIPPLIIQIPDGDERSIDQAKRAIASFNQQQALIISKNASFEIGDVNGGGGGNENMFLSVIENSNTEISKALLGSTMVLEDGSSLSQSEVHENNTSKFIRDLRNKMLANLNDDLFPKLNKIGCPIPLNARIVEERINDLQEGTKANLIASVIGDPRFKISKETIEQLTGIPVEDVESIGDDIKYNEYSELIK